MSVEIRVGERLANIHRPEVKGVWAHGGTVFVNLEADGVRVTLFFDPEPFRDLMAKGRAIAAKQAEQLRAELATVQALAEDAPEVAT